MKTFDANYRLLEEMYQDEYYPDFLVDKVKTELQKVIPSFGLQFQVVIEIMS